MIKQLAPPEKELEPVLAEIFYLNDLGRGTYYEVVYYSGGIWHSYAGSNTFNDGEQVLRWRYATDCLALADNEALKPISY